MRTVLLVLLTIAPCALSGLASAQPVDSSRSFRTLSLSGGGQFNLNDNTRLHEFWSPGRGAWLSLASPFFAGRANLYFSADHYGSIDRRAPEFTGLMTAVGWGLPVEVGPRLELYGGLRTGLYIMVFDAPNESGESPFESEVVVAPHGQVAYRVADGWQVYVSVQHLHLFVRERLALTYGGLGVRHTFSTPSWLRTVLQ